MSCSVQDIYIKSRYVTGSNTAPASLLYNSFILVLMGHQGMKSEPESRQALNSGSAAVEKSCEVLRFPDQITGKVMLHPFARDLGFQG